MSSRTSMNISLTPELAKLIHKKVASGRYASASEVVREGLRLLDDRERERAAALRDVRQKVALGLEDISQGRTVDGEDFFRELKSHSRSIRRRKRQRA